MAITVVPDASERTEVGKLGVLDPEAADEGYRTRLRTLLAGGELRVLCIATPLQSTQETIAAFQQALLLRIQPRVVGRG